MMPAFPLDRHGGHYGGSATSGVLANLSVSNLAALAAVPTGALPEGALVYVESLACHWMLRQSAAALVPFELINASGAGRQWWRQPGELNHSNPWALQAAWSVDGTAGNDEAAGTVLAPIKTLAELLRRVGESEIDQAVAVQIAGGVGPMAGRINFGPAGYMYLDGQALATSLLTAEVATSTALSVAGQEFNLLSLTGVADLTPYVGNRVRVLDGPNAGALAWIARVNPGGLGNGMARVSFWDVADITTTAGIFMGDSSNKLPVAGNHVMIEDPTANIDTLDLFIRPNRSPYTAVLTIGNAVINAAGNFVRCTLDGSENFGLRAGCYGCRVRGSSNLGGTYAQCLIDPGGFGVFAGRSAFVEPMFVFGPLVRADGGGFATAMFSEIQLYNALFQNAQLYPGFNSATYLSAYAAIFDVTGAHEGIRLDGHCKVMAADWLFGNGNANYGVRLRGGDSRLTYPSGKVPSLTGTSGPILAGAVPHVWADAPFFDSTAQMGIYVG